MGAQASQSDKSKAPAAPDPLGCSAVRSSDWSPDCLCGPDRSKDTKMSTGFESNFMQFEADGRYNRVFDLAEEGVEVSDMDLLTKFPHRMEQLSSPLERRGTGTRSPDSPLRSPTQRGIPRRAGVTMVRDTTEYTQGSDIGLPFIPTNVSANAIAGLRKEAGTMPSPRGIDSPRTDAGKHTLDFKSGGENDMFVKKATGTEDRRTRALAGMTLGSSLFGGVDESSAADGSCDDNSMSDTPESRSPTRLASPRDLKTHSMSNDKLIHDEWTKHVMLTGSQRMMEHKSEIAQAKAQEMSQTVRKRRVGLMTETSRMNFR